MEPTGSHSYEGSTWSWKPQKKEAAKPGCHPWIPMADCCVLTTATKLSLLQISFHSGLKNVASEKCGLWVEIATNQTPMEH